MAMNNIQTAVRNGMCDVLVDAVDVGSGLANGQLHIYTAGFATQLAILDFGNPAFGAAASGTATANSITGEDSALDDGTAAVARIIDRDSTVVCELSVGTSGADINLNSVGITTGATVDITSATITMPAA